MKVIEELTNALYEVARRDLSEVRNERSMSKRVGMTIKAIRNAIDKTNLYIWSGSPHFYTGKIYEPVDQSEFKGCIFNLMVRANMEASDFTQIEKIQRISMQAVMGKPLRLRKDIVVFENCVLLMGEMIPMDEDEFDEEGNRKVQPFIVPHSPELAQITMCHFDYDPNSLCPKWDMFLENVLDNTQVRMVLQEFLGCMFIDRRQHKFESMLILVGGGSNGKGVVSETVRGIIGSDSMTAFGLDSILSGTESLHNIAKMNGKRANWCTEIQAIQAGKYTDKLKTLISGEPIECRQMYGFPFTATEIPVLIANCNALPPMQDKSYGMQRRFIIIRFDRTIPVSQQDKQLLAKLRPEYSGIFNWILEGRQRYIDQHFQFTKCKKIDDAVQNYLEAANNVEEWCASTTYRSTPEDVMEHEAMQMPAKSAYDEYSRWCISQCLSPYSISKFGQLMTNAGFQKRRNSNGVCYQVYGERAMAKISQRKKKELTKQLIENGGIYNGQELRNGRVYDIGDEVAAKQWHLSRPYLVLLRRGRYLDGVWRKEYRKHEKNSSHFFDMYVYDHIKLGQRLEAYGVYDAMDDGRTLSERRRDQIRRAKAFNDEMKRMNKPFRKLTGKKSSYGEGAVFVDPDWEYTPDAAEALLRFVADLHAERKKDSAVKVSNKGKMTGAKKSKILADAIAEKLAGVDKEDSGVDPDTGEVLEIDIEDGDFKIV